MDGRHARLNHLILEVRNSITRCRSKRLSRSSVAVVRRKLYTQPSLGRLFLLVWRVEITGALRMAMNQSPAHAPNVEKMRCWLTRVNVRHASVSWSTPVAKTAKSHYPWKNGCTPRVNVVTASIDGTKLWLSNRFPKADINCYEKSLRHIERTVNAFALRVTVRLPSLRLSLAHSNPNSFECISFIRVLINWSSDVKSIFRSRD